MKRLVLSLAMMGAGLLGGCSDTQAVLTAAGLSGTYDLAIVGQYVFVTSSDRNELRVMDLNSDPRGFVPAPNPLEPLSIPVLERPTYLTRDVYYRLVDVKNAEGQVVEAKGKEVLGNYVYARSDGAQQISVVSASASDELNLRELHRLGRPGALGPDGMPRPVLGFVTAFAARGPGPGRSESVLYYATQNAADATLWKQVLPGPDTLTPELTLPLPVSVTSLPGETVTALLVLPSNRPAVEGDPNPPEQEYLAVATRGTLGAAGRTFRLDASRPQDPIVTYAFGAPVRSLATHSVVANTSFGGDVDQPDPTEEDPSNLDKACGLDDTQPRRSTLWAGELVFGLLDESSCGGGAECSGVLAVDSATGMVPLDSTGFPMIPIRTGGGLPTGLTLVQDARVQIRCTDESEVQVRPLVAVVPSTDGQITLFDAAKLRPFNFITTGPSVTGLAIVNAAGTNKSSDSQFDPAPFIGVTVRNGATRSDTYRMVNEGPLPPPRRRTFSAGTNCAQGGGCTFEVGSTQEAQFLLPKDYIVLEGEGDACELLVTAKDESVPTQVKLVTEPLPEGCADRKRFSVRAGPDSGARFAVYSDVRGFEGRLAAGGTLEIAGDYLIHPVGFTNEQPVFRVKLSLNRTLEPLERGDQYIAIVQSGFQPYVFSPDTGSLGSGLSNYRLPGPVSHTRVNDVDFAYIAYPSADGILQVNLAAITDNAVLRTGLVPFE